MRLLLLLLILLQGCNVLGKTEVFGFSFDTQKTKPPPDKRFIDLQRQDNTPDETGVNSTKTLYAPTCH